jgi:hypothetical protein
MMDNIGSWLRSITETAMIVVGLGVVLQVLFPQALVFINADVSGNLIGLINQFSGAGLIGLVAAGIVYSVVQKK